jgi:hypothetical protein
LILSPESESCLFFKIKFMKSATYHRTGWKPKAGLVVVNQNEDGSVDLASAEGGDAVVTGLPVFDGKGDAPAGSYAVIESAAAKVSEDKPAATPKKK